MSPTSETPETEIVENEMLEVVGTSAMEALVRGEIDIQIATAKAYPRSLERFYKTATAMATLDEETAESCLYRRPVGKKKGANGRWETEYAEGMSVRMSEIVGASYGNLRVSASLIEQAEKFVRARGMAIDLETNFASSSEVIESTLKQDGTPFSPRMRVVVAKAALSKARRDATFQVVPKALAKPIESAVRRILLGDGLTLEKRRQKVVAWIAKIGIDEARVYAALGIEGPHDLNPDKLEVLTGLRTAIKDGDTSIDEAFPVVSDPLQPRRASERVAATNPQPPAHAPATAPASEPATAGTPSSAPAATEPAGASGQQIRGLRVVNTGFVRPKTGEPFYRVSTKTTTGADRHFVTRDEQLYKEAASFEGTENLVTVTCHAEGTDLVLDGLALYENGTTLFRE